MTIPAGQLDWPFPTEHPDVARAHYQQAMDLAQGAPAESQSLLRSALEILTQCSHVCGEMHPKFFDVTKEYRRMLERSGLSPEQAERQVDAVIANAKAAIVTA